MNFRKSNKLFALKAMLATFSPILFANTVAAQEAPFTINAKIEGLTDQMVVLTSEHKGKKTADSVLSKDGKFAFKGTAPGAMVYYLRLGKNGYMGVPLEPKENITINASIGKLNEATVTGSKSYPVWQEWFSGWNKITARAGVLYQKLDSISKSANKDDRAYVDAEFEKLNQRLVDSVESLVKKYPASPITPYIIIDRFINYPNFEKAASTYAALAPAAKNSTYGKELGESLKIAGKTGIGMKPAFTVPDRDGKPLKLSDYKGKVVLVDFWASWCGPCRKENPNLVKAYEKYHDKGFEIIGISLDDKKDNWLKAIEADKLAWLHASDLKGWKSDLALEYGIRSIPMSFLVDASGKIIAKDLRGEDLEKRLASIFK